MSAFMNLPRILGCVDVRKRGLWRKNSTLDGRAGGGERRTGDTLPGRTVRPARRPSPRSPAGLVPAEQPDRPERTGSDDGGGRDRQDPGPDDLAGDAPPDGRKPPRGADADDGPGDG